MYTVYHMLVHSMYIGQATVFYWGHCKSFVSLVGPVHVFSGVMLVWNCFMNKLKDEVTSYNNRETRTNTRRVSNELMSVFTKAFTTVLLIFRISRKTTART